MSVRKSALSIFLFFSCMMAQAQTKDSIAIVKATNSFISAFINFDWPNFRNAFSTEATIFFPSWEEGMRKTGKKEIETTWTKIFPEFIDSTKKFDLKIDPKNILIQVYGNTAIVTFHLIPKPDYLSRRTIVFIKEREEWKIVHLHASSLTEGK